jgi:hypothetical protein
VARESPDGGWSNLAHILNRTGETLCTHSKFAAFHDEKWGEEAIDLVYLIESAGKQPFLRRHL